MEDQLIQDRITNIVNSIKPYDQLEEEHIIDVVDWISSGADIFRIKKDAIPPKHLVSYSVVVDLERKKILLFNHKKAQLMLPSGGHIDNNEMPLIAAKRELNEELGLSLNSILDPQDLPFFITVTQTVGISEKHTDVSLWYLFDGNSIVNLNEEAESFEMEFEGYHWLNFDEILSLPINKFDPQMHRFVKKLQLHLKNSS